MSGGLTISVQRLQQQYKITVQHNVSRPIFRIWWRRYSLINRNFLISWNASTHNSNQLMSSQFDNNTCKVFAGIQIHQYMYIYIYIYKTRFINLIRTHHLVLTYQLFLKNLPIKSKRSPWNYSCKENLTLAFILILRDVMAIWKRVSAIWAHSWSTLELLDLI